MENKHTCRYIHGDPREQYHYCCAPCVNNTDWCEKHFKMVYNNHKKILKEKSATVYFSSQISYYNGRFIKQIFNIQA